MNAEYEIIKYIDVRENIWGLEMELSEVLKMIKEDFPNKAIEISASLDLLKESIGGAIDSAKKKISSCMDDREFDSSKEYFDLASQVAQYEQKIDEIIEQLQLEELVVEDETDEEIEKRMIINYAEYEVDRNVEHTLYEDFTHMRPYGFRLNDNKVIEVKTWQGMLVKTCEYLIAIDEKKFMGFENKKSMNGKKNKYFTTNPKGMRRPKKVADKIYIEMNQSGNAIRNLIIKLLKEYDFKISDYKIFFRADYSEIKE